MDEKHNAITDATAEAVYPGNEALEVANPKDFASELDELARTRIAEERQEMLKKAKEGLELSVESDEVVNYAIEQQGISVVDDVCIKNTTNQDINDLTLYIDSDTRLIEEFKLGIQSVQVGEELHLKNLKIKINGDYLASLTERITCSIRFRICLDSEEVIASQKKIVALAFDQWPGLKYTPEILTAFSMPNHPVVTSLIQLAAQYLQKWTKDPSLAGYQYNDPNRVKQMAAAAFAAIQQKNITYANPPASFEEFGQRIRLADAVLEQHLGTCMDMTLLYCACLEAMGLNPIMVLVRGHIFAGVWLVEDSFSDTIMDDPSQLQKRMSNGIHEILVVECTAMNAGRNYDFDKACKLAAAKVANYDTFNFAIDVARARSMGIRPLPVRVLTDAGFVVQHDDRKQSEVTSASTIDLNNFDFTKLGNKQEATKQIQWERKLLDLSMRNMLINLRFTKAVVPLLCNNISTLEDALTEGEEFFVLPRPDNMGINGEITVEALTDLGPFQEYIELESKHKKLHSFYSEKELNSCLTKMYRSAKTSLEENGASTLYLALGLLRWSEGKKNETMRYAPIILVPIDIIRKSASKGYTMRMRDEDAQINITLLEFLKQNYEIEIPGLSTLPTDEHGLDLPLIFAIMRKGIMSLHMWDVIEAGFIGNFSFTQFVMWNDIHNHSDMLQRNNIVRSLIKGAVDWDCTIPEGVDTDEAYLPITADASQLRAINMAANGVSFVLHGPPGTGKSQTITAMIANALTKGKTVLFVAEKMAALEVVQKRLEALGIGDFCLELHSNKATKKAVLDQLRKNLELGVYGLKTDYNEKIEDIHKMREDIDAYVQKLHEQRTFGKSLKELIDIYEAIPDYGIELKFASEYVRTVTQSDLDSQRRALEQLVAIGRTLGHPHAHPLHEVGQTVYTQTLKMDLKDSITSYKNSLEEVKKTVGQMVDSLGMKAPVSESEWMNIKKDAEGIVASETIPSILLEVDNIDKAFDQPLAYMAEVEKLTARKNALLNTWKESFLLSDMSLLRRKYDEANRKFLGKSRALNNLAAEIQSFASFEVQVFQIPAIIADIEMYQREAAAVERKKNQLTFEWKQIIDVCPTGEALKRYRDDVKRQLATISQFSEKLQQLGKNGKRTDCIEQAKLVVMAFHTMEECQAKAVKLLQLTFDDIETNWIDARLACCDNLIQNSATIKDWIVYKQFDQSCRQAGLAVVCEAYADGLEHEQVMSVYLRSIYKAIILSVIENEPVLNSFTGSSFNEKIYQFKKLDTEFMDLTKEEMYYILTHNLPSPYTSVEFSKELNILRRFISSNGRGMSIRGLFDQIPQILRKLTPCMLMSPISVAQYLDADQEQYDIVIFDEASQLPTCKAVGVLARGKNAVIVGDPNQMPPTSFFAGNTVDEDNLDIEDLDSILDDCLALGMPQAHLQWHYRSRHESLIAFSNNEFYENSMLTFPSVNDREKRVSMVKVDGFFNRKKGRVNEGEGTAIVKEIKRRYKDSVLKNQSIGVVTFNISQQTLIEDLLQEEFAKDTEFDKWANNEGERLFVKNLENVQGDERDIILFSVAFGPDEEGRLSLNFGPLNKEGGWKRLNVAVSRARSEMVVFSTMTADMIDLKRTKSKGVEALKDFLEFAQKGKLQYMVSESRETKYHGIMDELCQTLENAGYKYQKYVGHSRFKVDIAVINPYNQDEYLMGIMMDGETYKQSMNTKDREVAQLSVLGGLGWNLHRIWTMDWWDNKQKEKDKLLELLNERKKEALKVAEQNGLTAEDNEISDTTENTILEERDDVAEKEIILLNDVKNEAEDSAEEKKGSIAEDTVNEHATNDIFDVKLTVPMENVEERKVAIKLETGTDSIITEKPSVKYRLEDYAEAAIHVTPMGTADYALKENMAEITEKLQRIVDAEAPITQDRLIKKCLRAFDINRSSPATLEATERAIKKLNAKANKQNGVKFFWNSNQNPDTYGVYRNDSANPDRRSPDEICQQELKNAVCLTVADGVSFDKDSLIKETIRTMGYARSGKALVDAVERGIKYGIKSGELVRNEDKTIGLMKSM